MAIEIVEFPINSMVIFHSFLLTFTRGYVHMLCVKALLLLETRLPTSLSETSSYRFHISSILIIQHVPRGWWFFSAPVVWWFSHESPFRLVEAYIYMISDHYKYIYTHNIHNNHYHFSPWLMLISPIATSSWRAPWSAGAPSTADRASLRWWLRSNVAEAPGDRCYKAMAMESLYIYIYIYVIYLSMAIYGIQPWNIHICMYVCMYVCMRACMYVWSRSESATKRSESATMSRQLRNALSRQPKPVWVGNQKRWVGNYESATKKALMFWHIFWHSIWHFIWHSIWHTFWHSIWHIF